MGSSSKSLSDKLKKWASHINPELGYDYELQTYYVLILEIIFVHIFHFALFIYVFNFYLIVWNIVSVTLYIMTFALLQKKLISSLFIIVHLEVLSYVIFTNYIIGWELYIALTIFALLVALVFDPFRKKVTKHLLAWLEIGVLTILVVLSGHSATPVMPIKDFEILHIVRILNIFACAIGIYAMVSISKLANREAYREVERSYNISKRRMKVDPITKVLCKDYVISEISEIHRLYRYSSLSYVVMVLKIDGFFELENKYGNVVTNRILFEVANLINKNVGNNNLVARWDEDKFLIALNNSKVNTAIVVAETIREEIDRYAYISEDALFDVTASIAVAEVKRKFDVMDAVETASDLLDNARVKSRNQVIY